MEGQEQQLLSFLSTNQNLSREQPNNFLQYFCCLRVYHLNFYLLCSEFFMSKNTYIPNIHVCSIKVFWSRPIYSRVASADSAQHQSIRPLFCWWAARQWRERYAALKHSHHLCCFWRKRKRRTGDSVLLSAAQALYYSQINYWSQGDTWKIDTIWNPWPESHHILCDTLKTSFLMLPFNITFLEPTNVILETA